MTPVNTLMMPFWVLAPCRLSVNASVSEKHTVSIFRFEVELLGSDSEDGDGILHRNVRIYRRN
jgi:hypothetical protein